MKFEWMTPEIEKSKTLSLLLFYLLTHMDGDCSALIPIYALSKEWGIHRSTLHRGIDALIKRNICATKENRLQLLGMPKGRMTQVTHAPSTQRFDLEKLYQTYPKKRGKTPGLKRLTKEIKNEDDYLKLEKAILNYSRCVKDTQLQYILHFSTFTSQWRDWIEPPAQKFSINVKPISLDEL